ncbi:MAG: hypothetical protein WDO24_14460 [Pseudomonadota bacterium]
MLGGPPGVRRTSWIGLPEIVTSRPPTWNEPMSRSTIGGSSACAGSAIDPASAANAAIAQQRIIASSRHILTRRASRSRGQQSMTIRRRASGDLL